MMKKIFSFVIICFFVVYFIYNIYTAIRSHYLEENFDKFSKECITSICIRIDGGEYTLTSSSDCYDYIVDTYFKLKKIYNNPAADYYRGEHSDGFRVWFYEENKLLYEVNIGFSDEKGVWRQHIWNAENTELYRTYYIDVNDISSYLNNVRRLIKSN